MTCTITASKYKFKHARGKAGWQTGFIFCARRRMEGERYILNGADGSIVSFAY
ncbi:MAG: hypothetical protein SPF51_03075 [Candidatus Fimivicinus sp.]|nr:hypothetical protein [Candidatus Fimivicinus sp.]